MSKRCFFFFCFYIFYSMFFFFLFNLQHYFIIDKSLKLLTKNTDRNESSTTGALIEQGEEIRQNNTKRNTQKRILDVFSSLEERNSEETRILSLTVHVISLFYFHICIVRSFVLSWFSTPKQHSHNHSVLSSFCISCKNILIFNSSFTSFIFNVLALFLRMHPRQNISKNRALSQFQKTFTKSYNI